jgi:putative transposase
VSPRKDRTTIVLDTNILITGIPLGQREPLKATECLAKDRDTLLTFYDYPAEHWLHIRTTNPIESTFATVRLRTTKTRGCVSRAGMLAMVFKLTKTAEQKWRTLKGHALLAQVIEGVQFKDGLQEGTQRIAA